ncbi:MAG: T9SS type A sorting domain-containing protein [Cyclobacteriaceae bacterium]
MNKRVLHLIALLLLSTTAAFSQAVSMTAATGGLSGAAQISGTNDIAILGVQLTKAAGGGNTVTTITVGMTPTPVGKFTNARLYESTDATFSGVGTETQIATGTISATDIVFTAAPLTNFDGATAAADDEYFFIVVDVAPAATGSTTPSLASTGVVLSTGTTTGSTITGSTYTLTPPQTTIANLATGLAASPLQAGATGQGVFGFSLTSNGTQTLSTLNIQTGNTSVGKWSSFALITSTDNSFATTGDNSAAIGGLTFNATATEIQITGLSQSITTSGTNFFLVADVNAAVNGSTTAVTPSLGSANATATTGTFTGTATGTAYSFAPLLTIANLTTGLASSPLTAGATNQGVFGFSLTSSGSQTVTVVNVQLSSTPASKWSNYRLITSTDASYATAGDNSAPIGGLTFTPSASQVAITGLSQVITSGTNYFLVVDVDPAVNGATTAVQPSLAAGNITITTGGGIATGTATGTSYNFGPLLTIANLTTGLASSPLTAGSTNQGVFGFSLTSSGSQTVTVLNVQLSSTPASKWTNYRLITSTDASYATAGDNSAAIGGLTFTPSATQVAITGLSQVITSGTNYFLVVDVDPSVNGSTTAVQPSLGGGNVTITTGGGAATGTATGTSYSFVPLLTVANLSTGLAGSPLTAGSSNQGVFGFSLTSSGTQTVSVINVQLSSTPSSKWSNYRLITSTDASYATAGDNSAPIGGLTFTPSASQVAITGLSQVITSGTNYFLVVDVDPTVTGATTAVQPSLVAANITASSGGVAGTASGTSYSFVSATATFAQLSTGIASSPLFAGTTNQAVIGFSATSNGSQTFSAINIQTSSTPISKWGSYSLVRSTDNSFTTTGDNTTIGGLTFTPSASQIAITGLTETLNGTTKNYFLVITVDPGVTSSTTAVQPSFTQANVTVVGTVAAGTITGTTYSFNTSQNSDIIFTGGSSTAYAYRSFQAGTIDDTNLSLSQRIASFQVREGGGSADGDNKVTSITQLQVQVTNVENIQRIALFNDDTDTEVAGTEQTAPAGPGTATITFTPASPLRTTADGTDLNIMIRVTFKPAVTDNAQIVATITSVTGEAGFSGFASANGGGANSSGAANKTIIVNASKLILSPGIAPNPSPKSTNFALTIKAVDGNPFNNIDADYNGKVDITASGGPGSLTGGGQKTLAAGQFAASTLQIDQAGTYTIDVSDDDYTDAPDNQNDIGDASGSITITSSASTIISPGALNLCYGGAFQTLGNIQIVETDAAGFSNTGSFSIALPTGFVFDTGTNPTLTMSNSTTTFSSIGFTGNNIVQFDYSLTAPSGLNTLTISGLKIRYPGSTAPSGGVQITRAGGTATIAGVVAGTQLATVTATLGTPPVGLGFTVIKLNSGDVTVQPNETRFSQSSNAVKLVGSPAGGTFSGPGVTNVSGEWRFNPQSLSLSPPLYDIVYTYTDGSPQACQFTVTKQFEVYSTNITGLLASYCNNDATSPTLSAASYISTFYPTYTFVRFVYWNTPGGRNTNGTINIGALPGPVNLGNTLVPGNTFDPKLAEYQPVYSATGSVYGTIGIWIGFEITDGVSTFIIWQLIPVRPAPSVSINTSSIPSQFCADESAVTLIGNPPNSNDIGNDLFTPVSGPVGAVTYSASDPKVWSFNPSAHPAGGTSTITYTYRDPSTNCSATSAPITLTVNVRPPSVAPTVVAAPGIAPETCQGAPIGTFIINNPPLTSPDKYQWYSDANLTTLESTGNNFSPPSTLVNPNVVSTTKFYVTQVINGCESNRLSTAANPALELSVIVKTSPPAPTPNFNNSPDREFCLGTPIDPSKLVVPGTGVQWYLPGNSTSFFAGTSPDTAALHIPHPTTQPTTYDFEVTQTVSLCESPRTLVRVKIKGLPILSVSSGASDPLKICTEGGHDGGSPTLITFSGSDENGPVSTGSWTVQSGTLPLGALIPGGGTALLTTPTLIPGNYILRFSHTNSALCTNFIDIPLTVLPKIKPILDPQDSCFESFVRLNNKSTIQTGPSSTALVTQADVLSTSWNFNDGNTLAAGNGPIVGVVNSGRTKGTYLSPEHNFENLGSKSVTYTMTTTYCAFAGTEQITIHPKPKIDFSWQNPCFDSVAMKSSTRFIAKETTSPTVPINQYLWNFNTESNLTHSGTPVGGSPTVNYTRVGSDSVELIAVTVNQCRDTVKQIVHVLPIYESITPSTGYDQNFNASNNFWFTGGVKSSWQLGNTTAGADPSDGAAWATNLAGPYNDGENSWVMSGCFNFKDATKPVVSLDAWSDTPFGVDGTVMQYNDDGIIQSEGSWKVLGDVGSGINWYDATGISNSPGNQSANDYGWTGTYPGWKKAIYKLDNVIGDTIVFRIAFAGNNRKSGFAFDNVFIGERSRVVLFENFTNTSPEANPTLATTVHNTKYDSAGKVSNGEIVKVQYHTPFPGNDLLNEDNEQMNNARAAFYGITEAPTARVDGGFENGNLVSWFDDYNDDRVLTPSVVDIDATTTKVGRDVKINITLTNTATQSIPLEGINVFTVIVKKQIDRVGNENLFGSSGNNRFVYVAKQMLPSAAGLPLSGSLAGGAMITIPELTWSNPNGDAIVVFVQRIDGETKTVYQSFFLGSPAMPDLITGTEDPEYMKNIHVYPNPANHVMNIELPAVAAKPTPVLMIDAFGKTVYQSEFGMGEKTKAVSTETMADGVYMLQLTTPGGSKAVRKVMVKH